MVTQRSFDLRFSLKKWILVLLILAGFILPVFAVPVLAGSPDDWVWPKGYSKPEWWTWGDAYSKETPVRGGYARYAALREVGLFNPNHWPVNDWETLDSLHDRLILIDGDVRPMVPWLATSWEYENDLTILMKLRKGVTFHDGEVFNAKAVKYHVDWIMNPKNGAWSRNWITSLKSIEVVDEFTVRWNLSKPWAHFLDVFANVPGWMISPKALKADEAMVDARRIANKIKLSERRVKKHGKGSEKGRKELEKITGLKADLEKAEAISKGARSVDEWPAGSGPYMMEEVRPGNYTKTKRNPDWWFGKAVGKPDMPYLDGNIITVIPDYSVQLANLKAGKIDFLYIDKNQYGEVKDDPKLDVWVTDLNWNIFMNFNHNSVFKDIRLRKAVSHAIDRKALIAANERGFARIATGFFPDDHFAHNPDLKPHKYDPELARKLVKEAGYPNGLTVKGVLRSDGVARRYGEIIRTMLQMVGIKWEVDFIDPVALADKHRNLEYDVATIELTYIKNPDSYLTNEYHNLTQENKRQENKAVNALIEAARSEMSFEKRQKMYWEIERLLDENYEDVYLYYPQVISASRKQFRGYNREMAIAGGETYGKSHLPWFKNGKRF